MAKTVIVHAYLEGYEGSDLSKTIRVTADDDTDDDALLDAVVDHYTATFFDNVYAQAEVV